MFVVDINYMATQKEQELNKYISEALEKYLEAEECMEKLTELFENYRNHDQKFLITLKRGSEIKSDHNRVISIVKQK